MEPVYIAMSVPIFFVLIGIEIWVTKRRGIHSYRLHDSITDLSCGVGSLVHGAFISLLALGVYVAVWVGVGIWEVPTGSVLMWVLAFVAVDFAYYWYHRAGHRVNFIWAGHVVHHQSEDYNLAVALRQSWYSPLIQFFFYLPLAVVGFPPVMFLTAKTFNTLYQFWIHTETINRMGPFEWIFNTPSHHRVHHGTNPEYVDKNYAGILIIWDRMFGTWVPEEGEVVYGTVKPLSSWNPFWANLANWSALAKMARSTGRLRDKIRIFLAPPEWRPDDLGGPVTVPETSRAQQTKYSTRSHPKIDRYVVANFVVVGFAITGFLLLQNTLPPLHLFGFGAIIVAAATAWGGLFEGKTWARPVEFTRWALTPLLVLFLAWDLDLRWAISLGAAALSVGFAIWASRLPIGGAEAVEANDENSVVVSA